MAGAAVVEDVRAERSSEALVREEDMIELRSVVHHRAFAAPASAGCAPDTVPRKVLAACVGLVGLVEEAAVEVTVAPESVERVERFAMRRCVEVAADDHSLPTGDAILQKTMDELRLPRACGMGLG